MSEITVMPSLFMLIRISEEGNFQLALANGTQQAKERMEKEGFRAFELCNEKSIQDLS